MCLFVPATIRLEIARRFDTPLTCLPFIVMREEDSFTDVNARNHFRAAQIQGLAEGFVAPTVPEFDFDGSKVQRSRRELRDHARCAVHLLERLLVASKEARKVRPKLAPLVRRQTGHSNRCDIYGRIISRCLYIFVLLKGS